MSPRSSRQLLVSLPLLLLLLCSCEAKPRGTVEVKRTPVRNVANGPVPQNTSRVVHVVVALCDNEHQGIVPVPARIGNGDDPGNNLYWGAAFGVKSFFRKASDWSFIGTIASRNPIVLDRVLFKHKTHDVYLVADAYRGREIAQCTADFLHFSSGGGAEAIEVTVGGKTHMLSAGGAADLIAYIGHDGLMDFTLSHYPEKSDDRVRDAIILACISKSYFDEPLRKTGARPLLWTTGLMAPEAYVLKAALDGWVLGKGGEEIRKSAASAYNKYQKCGQKAAMRLFATGW